MAKFITFEGIDGTGKSSICEAVHKELLDKGYKVVHTMEPSDGWLGGLVRESYKRAISPFSEALLFCADRAEHTREICTWLAKGYHVLCDRYVDSTVAYQGAILRPYFKAKKGQDLLTWLKELNRPYIQCPDLTVVLLCPPELCLERIGERGATSKFERLDLLRAIEANYLELCKGSSRFVKVDARRSLEEVCAKAIKIVKAVIGKELRPKPVKPKEEDGEDGDETTDEEEPVEEEDPCDKPCEE
jgi:dTMP kinase